MKAVLLPNLVEFPSFSMKRYAAELFPALQKVGGEEWQIHEHICTHVGAAAKLIPGKAGEKMASRLGRFVKYPLRAARLSGDVFHVLDHSHANLALALPPEKSVLTCHDCIPLLAARGEIDMPGASAIMRFSFPLRLKCIRRCAYTIADSESTKRDLMRLAGIPEEKIVVAYIGVNSTFTSLPPKGTIEEERAMIRAKYQIPPDAKIIMHVGTKNRYKNTPAVLNTLAILRKNTPFGENIWLLRVGSFFDDEQELAQSLGIQDRILPVTDARDDAALAVHYRASDVFLFPSLYEGFGWPPLEAMACGVPVVASNAASLPEVVGDAGLMAPPHDYAQFAQHIEQLLTNEELRRDFAVRALLRAQRFSWEQCATTILSVYQRIAHERRTRS